jgi:hypothetical protein
MALNLDKLLGVSICCGVSVLLGEGCDPFLLPGSCHSGLNIREGREHD